MSSEDEFHEREVVNLRTAATCSRVDLHRFLLGLGFTSEDDYYYFDRPKSIPRWQSLTLLSVDVLRAGEPIYETEDDVQDGETTDWDCLQIGYLLATLPTQCIDDATALIETIAQRFRLTIWYQDAQTEAATLRQNWAAIADRLRKDFAEPGSEDLQILIRLKHST